MVSYYWLAKSNYLFVYFLQSRIRRISGLLFSLLEGQNGAYAHLYRAGIFGYIWLAPVGCHMNMGVLNMAYKYLFQADKGLANKFGNAFMFGGLLAALPDQKSFDRFKEKISIRKST